MAVSAVPGSLLGRIAADSGRIRAAFRTRAAKSAATRHALTAVALAVGDVVAFAHGFTFGGLSLMGSLLLLDYKLQD